MSLPEPLTPVDRKIIEVAKLGAKILREHFNGTGKLSITIDYKDFNPVNFRPIVEGPRQ